MSYGAKIKAPSKNLKTTKEHPYKEKNGVLPSDLNQIKNYKLNCMNKRQILVTPKHVRGLILEGRKMHVLKERKKNTISNV